jgi:hypothetical protein
MPEEFKKVLNESVKIVNFIKTRLPVVIQWGTAEVKS